MQFFTPHAVIIATLSGFVFGLLWYGVLFAKAWMIGEGVTKSELPKRSKVYIFQVNAYSLLAHGALTSVLALIFDIVQVASLKVAVSLGLLVAFGFIVTTKYVDMLYTIKGMHWNKESQVKFLVSSGYYLCMVAIVSAVLFWIA